MEIGVAIRDIVLTEWNVRGPFHNQEKNDFRLTMDTNIKVSVENKSVMVINKIKYYYENDPKHFVLDGTVLTDFVLQLPKEAIDGDTMDVPDQAFITMISIGISHTRAVFLQQTKAAGLYGQVLPLVNPTEIFERIKPSLIKNSSK